MLLRASVECTFNEMLSLPKAPAQHLVNATPPAPAPGQPFSFSLQPSDYQGLENVIWSENRFSFLPLCLISLYQSL